MSKPMKLTRIKMMKGVIPDEMLPEQSAVPVSSQPLTPWPVGQPAAAVSDGLDGRIRYPRYTAIIDSQIDRWIDRQLERQIVSQIG